MLVSKENIKVKAETDYMEEVVNRRQDDLNNIESLMNDINLIAKDLNVNTKA